MHTLAYTNSHTEMEIIQEGRNFRLIQDSELSDVLVILNQYLPESLKVYF